MRTYISSRALNKSNLPVLQQSTVLVNCLTNYFFSLQFLDCFVFVFVLFRFYLIGDVLNAKF